MKEGKVTVQDLARLAGTSTATVSRALNDKAGVSEELRARIKQLARHHGYIPKRKYQEEILLVLPSADISLASPYTKGLAVLQEGLLRSDCVVISDYSRNPKAQLQIMKSRDIKLVIYFCCTPDTAVCTEAVRSQVQLVLIHRESTLPNVSSFISDDCYGGYLATSHLLAQGRKKVAFLGLDQDHYSPRMRWEGYCKAMSEQGLPPLRWEEAILRSPALGEQVREKGVNGVFVWADHVAQRLIEVLHYQGVAVPHQVAVVGYNDLASIVENTVPPLSSVNWPIDQVCQWAMEYITQYLTRGSQIRPMKVKIAPELIVRDSSKTTGLAKTLSS